MPAIDRLLIRVRDAGGSDLHVADGQPPWMRRHGKLAALADEQPLPADALGAMLREIAPPAQWEKYERTGDATFAYTLDAQLRTRANCYRQAAGRGAVCRIVPLAVPALADLGLPPVLNEFAKLRNGLVLLAGPTGAGVSTTAAALCQDIALNQNRRILMLEDPIEFLLAPRRSTVAQREPGTEGQSLAALHDAPRAGFDVAYVGELHDCESISMALTTAESGLLVFGTLRAGSVVRALDQIVNMFPEEQKQWVKIMLANVLRGVCVQYLLPKADGTGRCAACETLAGTAGVAAAIREGYISKLNTMIQSGAADGMMTLDDSLGKRIEAKLITPADALLCAHDKARFQALIKEPEAPGAAPGGPPKTATPQQPAMTGRTQFLPPRSGGGRA
jgi:twitching motility protein PilT